MPNNAFDLTIVTPEKTLYKGKSSYLSLNTDDGQQVILPGHESYMSQVALGELTYTNDKNESLPFAVSSGFLQVNGNQVNVLLDNALATKDIDIQKAQDAIKRAEEMLTTQKSETEISKLKSQIKLANLHIATAKKYKTVRTSATEEVERM